MGCHFLLQGIFLIQGLNPSLLHWPTGSLLPSEPPGKPTGNMAKTIDTKGWGLRTESAYSFIGHPWWLSGKECLPAQEKQVQSLGQEDPLEEEMATRSSILA